ncbi:MAG: hypothetical protein U0Q47_09075 [Mycobacterium sp.]
MADDRQNPDAAGWDNVLPYADQALFLAMRGARQEAVMQVIWIYEHPLDMEGIRRFHDDYGHGLMARRIERSPLPFGRHRWVAAPGAQADLDISRCPRPRDELYEWADEQIELPLDPEWGPGWRLGVQPLTDGSTAVGLVVSHCLADGAALVISLADAVSGTIRDLGYPPPRSRARRRAVYADLRQVVRDLPEVARTVAKAAKVAGRRRHDLTRPTTTAPNVVGLCQTTVALPSASAIVDIDQWDLRAEKLGGNSFSLVCGFAARVARSLGRTRCADGAVTLLIPVSEREDLADARGNVVSIATVRVDPESVNADLTDARTAIREGIRVARETPDEMIELLPLISFVPKRAFGRMADMAFGFTADLPVSVSNMGDLPSEIIGADGTAAEYACFRGVDRQVPLESLERRRGVVSVISGRIAGKIILTVVGYQPGVENTRANLRSLLSQALSDFELTGVIL